MTTENQPAEVNPMDDELSLDESRELLAEVREAFADEPQSELFGFAGMLCQVIDLHERAGEGREDGQETIRFIASSLDEIRSIFATDQSTSERLSSLQEEAVGRWGDQLASVSQDEEGVDEAGDAFEASMEAWGHDDQEHGDEGAMCEQEDDFDAPSAEAISSLLSQLGQAPPDVPNQPEQATPDPPRAQVDPESSAGHAANESPKPSQEPAEESDTTSIDSLDPELREAFLDDASSCVASMEDSMLRLESNPSDADSLNQILRELHTLKGASASVGLSKLADQLHHLEDRLRDDQIAGRAPEINSLLKSVDSVRAQISGDPEDAPVESAAPAASATGEPTSAAAPADPAPAGAPAPSMPTISEGPADDESVRVKSSQLNRLMDMLAELVMLRNRRETELAELQETYHELIGSVSKMRMLSNEGHVDPSASTSLQLSEIANDVLEAAQSLRDCARPVAEGNTAVSQFIRQFRQELVELRRTPVSGLFRRLQRVVRDAAQAESKEVRLQLLGEDAGIERSLQQRLYEPLLHIVRNSVCHGIETPDDRQRSGKERTGTITLEAKSGTDMFVIEIRDNGRGLDYDAIRRRGIDKGLLAADQVATREELAQLIFQPGFSTRQTANQVAGRGVGMDVVASTLQRMRGWLEVDSEPNKGTRIRLSFPLPSVIQHAMVFRCSGQLFALPMQSVKTAGELQHDSICLTFSELLGENRVEDTSDCQAIVLASDDGARSRSVTLLVDEIVGPEEVVVRPLPSLLKQHPFCSGATLSGMGQAVLFLDARRVVETQTGRLHQPRLGAESGPGGGTQRQRPRVLVVDDSLSARKRVVRSLQRYPVDIVEASDGKEALEVFKRERFVAVFSDMEMPHISGMELLAEINADGAEDAPPVVIISSRGEDEFTVRARELGANNYLVKPLADEQLDEALTGMPSLRHLIQQPATEL